MPRLAYGLGAYKRTNSGLPPLRLVNCFVEAAEPVETPLLFGRPGMVAEADYGTAPMRGLYQWDGVLGSKRVAISDVLRLNGAAIGPLPGSDLVRMAAGEGEALALADGRLFRVLETGISSVAFPDGARVADVDFLRGRFVAIRKDTGVIYWSDILDGQAWDGLSFATAERQADPALALRVVGDEIWVFGSRTVEIWAPTPDADLPFAPVEARIFSQGCAARDTVAVLDNTVFWVGDDRVVYRGAAPPQKVSTNTVDEVLARVSPESMSAFSFGWRGHAFYVLRAAGEATFVYDASTWQWAEWKSYGAPEWVALCGVQEGAEVRVGSALSGKVWRLDDTAHADDGQALERVFTALAPTGRAVVGWGLEVDAVVGTAALGVQPVLEMRQSRDSGFTWGAWRAASLGAQGKYRQRVTWRRVGLIDRPGMVFEFRATDAAPFAVSGVVLNEISGGRSR